MGVIINNQTDSTLPDECEPLLTQLMTYYLEQEDIPLNAEVGLTFVDDDAIKELNVAHRGIDKATDVLSFPLYEPDEPFEEDAGMPILLGDVVISVPHAVAQADEYGHSVTREVAYLFVHGLLHLAGYDHMSEDERQDMRRQEETLLERAEVRRNG